MQITATLINYYFLCKRKMWLHANEIRMEHTSDVVKDGKLLHEVAYPQRAERYREIEMDGVKIDFYDPYNKVVHEIKRSDKIEKAHEAQVKYYIYVLENNGIEGVSGILEYPTLRKTDKVVLTDEDREEIKSWLTDIERIIMAEGCPPKVQKGICKNCSYFDFCWVEE